MEESTQVLLWQKLLGGSFEDTSENTQWKKVKQMQPIMSQPKYSYGKDCLACGSQAEENGAHSVLLTSCFTAKCCLLCEPAKSEV